ncbi:MAG: four helix bundle protein [Candidatus Paceibacterota bacterium]|jgi:hypothetical protein
MRKFTQAYKLWQEFVPHIPKSSRYTLGEKIDVLFIESIEMIYSAIYTKPIERLHFVITSATKLDALKFFLQILWETKQIDTKKYIALSKILDEIGRMIGGWIKQLGQRESSV